MKKKQIGREEGKSVSAFLSEKKISILFILWKYANKFRSMKRTLHLKFSSKKLDHNNALVRFNLIHNRRNGHTCVGAVSWKLHIRKHKFIEMHPTESKKIHDFAKFMLRNKASNIERISLIFYFTSWVHRYYEEEKWLCRQKSISQLTIDYYMT